MDSERNYWAFISYSHHDQRWADWLLHAVESYRVPRKLVGAPTPDGPRPNRLFPLFRDRDELAGSVRPERDDPPRFGLFAQFDRHLLAARGRLALGRGRNQDLQVPGSRGPRFLPDCRRRAEHHRPPRCGPARMPTVTRPPLRRRSCALLDAPIDPLAADARKGKDGLHNAKLKLLAALLHVGFDDLKQREQLRRQRQRVRLGLSAGLLLLASLLGYIAAADAGMGVPGGERARNVIDLYARSWWRPLYSSEEIERVAASQCGAGRRVAVPNRKRWHRGHAPDVPGRLHVLEYWTHCQALAALYNAPELSDAERRAYLVGLELPFAPGRPVEGLGNKYGWIDINGTQTRVVPGLWLTAAVAGRRHVRDCLSATTGGVWRSVWPTLRRRLRFIAPSKRGRGT